MIAISFPTPFLRTGLAVQQIRLDNEYSEQILYFSVAGVIRPENIPIRFGGSVKYESVGVENYQSVTVNNPSSLDLDLGGLIDITENLFWGYSIKNFLEP